jgi:hypothetical protein
MPNDIARILVGCRHDGAMKPGWAFTIFRPFRIEEIGEALWCVFALQTGV